MDISKMKPSELKALIEQASKQMTQALESAVKELAGKVTELAKETETTSAKVLDLLKAELGVKSSAGTVKAAGSGRAPSRNNILRRDFKEAGVPPFSLSTPLEVLEKAYIKQFGQAQFDEKIAVIPAPKTAKK